MQNNQKNLYVFATQNRLSQFPNGWHGVKNKIYRTSGEIYTSVRDENREAIKWCKYGISNTLFCKQFSEIYILNRDEIIDYETPKTIFSVIKMQELFPDIEITVYTNDEKEFDKCLNFLNPSIVKKIKVKNDKEIIENIWNFMQE